ncbi:MAG: hypothetical protein JW797_02470 [Bradymonadales bacterium]|nr:hypothetical protein [Bradymonadales bacterium]
MNEHQTGDLPGELQKNAPRVDTFVSQAFRRIAHRKEGRERPIPFPFGSLNAATDGGLWPGVHILTGTTGVGKTQFALHLAYHAARQGIPALYVSFDMDELSAITRLASLVSDHHWSTLYRGSTEQLAELEASTKTALAGVALHLETSTPFSWTGSALYSRLAAMKRDYSVGDNRPLLAVVDHLQLALGEKGDLHQCIGDTAYHARQAARSLNAVVVLISAVAEEHNHLANLEKQREPGRITPIPITSGGPNISPEQFKGIGAGTRQLEYSADSVLCLCREPRDVESPTEDVWLAVAKKRAGTTGWVHLLFDGSAFRDPLTASP